MENIEELGVEKNRIRWRRRNGENGNKSTGEGQRTETKEKKQSKSTRYLRMKLGDEYNYELQSFYRVLY